MPGPPPKPLALKLADGNPGKRALNMDEPKPPPGRVDPPMNLTMGGCRYWEELSPIVLAMGTLTPADVQAFADMCNDRALCEELRKDIARNGATFTLQTESGEVERARPQVGMLNMAAVRVRAADDRFGLNPSGRSRIRVERETKAADPLTEFARKSG